MNFHTLATIARLIRNEGPLEACRSISARISEKYHEWRLGISSSPVVGTDELRFQNKDFHDYWATPYRSFGTMMQAAGVNARSGDVFLDYGAGMGRVLVMAGMFSFDHIIGVEFSPQLAEIARRNIANARGRLKCREIEVIIADAAAFEVPDDVTVVYFNNPFHGETLARVTEKLHGSLQRRPRRLSVVCNNPSSESQFDYEFRSLCPWLTLSRRISLERGRLCCIYVGGS